MRPVTSTLFYLVFTVVLGCLSACSDSSDIGNSSPASESAALLAQFGSCQSTFSEAGMQGLLDFEDASSPVSLLQIMSVTDSAGFALYEKKLRVC
jgi:hypothetical protein